MGTFVLKYSVIVGRGLFGERMPIVSFVLTNVQCYLCWGVGPSEHLSTESFALKYSVIFPWGAGERVLMRRFVLKL